MNLTRCMLLHVSPLLEKRTKKYLSYLTAVIPKLKKTKF